MSWIVLTFAGCLSSMRLYLCGWLFCVPLMLYPASDSQWRPDLLTVQQIQSAQDRFEQAIVRFEQDPRIGDYPNDSIVFAGSSTIRLWQTLEQDMAPYPIIQRGFGGSDTASILWYAQRIFTPLQYRAVVFFSANDIMGRADDASPEEVVARVREIVAIARKGNPEMPVFWIAVTPTRARWHVWPQAAELNAALQLLADGDDHFYFIATEIHYRNEQGEPREELFVDDLLHLNADGYRILTHLVKTQLDRVLVRARNVE